MPWSTEMVKVSNRAEGLAAASRLSLEKRGSSCLQSCGALVFHDCHVLAIPFQPPNRCQPECFVLRINCKRFRPTPLLSYQQLGQPALVAPPLDRLLLNSCYSSVLYI